jgi:hypothetical protein
MTPIARRPAGHRLISAAASALALALATGPTFAGPGAHGPNGEHLDAPAATRAGPGLPRVDAATEAFELVAELRAGELAVLVDRYDTNAPVLGAVLEVESGALKAVAAFRAEQGDYVVTDSAMLAALRQPGEHALVFTLIAGGDSDLLDGTLVTGGAGPATGSGHDPDHELERAAWIGSGVAAALLIGGLALTRRRRRDSARAQGEL